MAATDKVMQYVERALSKDPGTPNKVLFEGAQKIDKAIGKLSIRQFHAKYPLQIKRRKGGSAGRKKAGAGRPAARAAKTRTPRSRAAARGAQATGADEVRKVLLRFARDLSAAETQLGTIEVMSNLDRYTTDILKATRA